MSHIGDLLTGSFNIETTKQSLKKLREMCTQADTQSQIMQQIGRHPTYLERLCCFLNDLELKGQADPAVQSFFLQFFVNIVTANEKNAVYLLQNLQLFGKEGQTSKQFCALLTVLCQKSKKNTRFVHIFLHNTIFAVKNTIPWMKLWQGSLEQILRIVFNDLRADQPHGDEELDKIFEWRCNLIKLLMDYPNKQTLSASQLLITLNQQHKFEMIHLIYLLLDKMINQQCSSTFIAQLIVPLFDIRQMHMKPYSLKFCMQLIDVSFLLRLFQQQLSEFRQDIKKMNNCQNFEILGQLVQLFSCLTFLGGYNAAVQNLFQMHIGRFCQFLHIAYLLYSISRQYDGYKKDYKTPYTYNHQVLEDFQKMFSVQPDQNRIHDYYTNILNSNEIFGVIIRFLSNLIHINPNNQKYFQQHFDMLCIIMSLTHMDQKQQTMREWSLIFIRNVCEVSQVLRNNIQSMKVDVKSV